MPKDVLNGTMMPTLTEKVAQEKASKAPVAGELRHDVCPFVRLRCRRSNLL